MFLSFPLVCASVQDARHTEFSLLVCSPCVGRKHTHVFAIGWTLRQAKMRNFPSTGCRCFRRPFPLTSMLRNEREANVDFAYTFDRGLYAAVPRAFHPPPITAPSSRILKPHQLSRLSRVISHRHQVSGLHGGILRAAAKGRRTSITKSPCRV